MHCAQPPAWLLGKVPDHKRICKLEWHIHLPLRSQHRCNKYSHLQVLWQSHTQHYCTHPTKHSASESPLNANQPHECWGSTSATGGESPSLNIVQIYQKKSRMKPRCCMLQGKAFFFPFISMVGLAAHTLPYPQQLQDAHAGSISSMYNQVLILNSTSSRAAGIWRYTPKADKSPAVYSQTKKEKCDSYHQPGHRRWS